MQITTSKWGNSLAIRIPKSFARSIGINNGEKLELELKNKQIVISKPEYSLENLLEKINTKNIHSETKTGSVIGKELW